MLFQARLIVAATCLIGLLGFETPAAAQAMDPSAAWPLCGRIMDNKPRRWKPEQGCPQSRWGTAAHADVPFNSTFGPRPLASEDGRYDFHRGIDLAAPIGTPVFAVADGRVDVAGEDPAYSDPVIKLRHYRPGFTTCSSGGGCYFSLYLHLSGWVVTPGSSVSKGQLIGYTGASASGFEHLHFEVRDAPADDPLSAWQRDAVHPARLLAWPVIEDTNIAFTAVDLTGADSSRVALTVSSSRYDLVAVELALFDLSGAEIVQPGNAPDPRGYQVLPSRWNMELWNSQYSHKDSATVPWASFGVGGLRECPYHEEHGPTYSPHLHLDAQFPGRPAEGLFNGLHVTTGNYWLNGARRYAIGLEFLALTGPAACVQATARFAAGGTATSSWGECGALPNQPPLADFGFQCSELACSFDGGGSSDADGSVVGWAWDFGDGTAGAGSVTGHVFPASGTYPVTLEVTDDAGATSTLVRDVSVKLRTKGKPR